jgi:hypothetical protein
MEKRLSRVKIVLCYCCVTGGPKTADLAARFVSTYHAWPPLVDHDTLIVSNGGPLPNEIATLFAPLKPQFWPRPNDPAWDIGAYLDAAKGPAKNYDMMLCFGESVHFHRAGWLARFVEAWAAAGAGMYGAFASNYPLGHLNTTAFVCSPGLLRWWEMRPRNKKERYAWEHGEHAFWRLARAKGFPVRMVTWDGSWALSAWRTPENILWKGNQKNCLVWANHTDRYFEASERTKRLWEARANQPFR